MKMGKDALRRFIAGELAPEWKGQEQAFFEKLVLKNSRNLSLLAAIGALLQAAAVFFLRGLPIMKDPLMFWFVLLLLTGLIVFSLFFYRQAKAAMPVMALWACQVAFAVYYTVADLSLMLLSAQLAPGSLLFVPLMLLGALMNMTGTLSLACFGAYLLGILLMAGSPVFAAYGLIAALAAYLLSRLRNGQLASLFTLEAERDAARLEAEALALKLERTTSWDEQTQMGNRRAISAWLEAVWPLCVRSRIPVAVLLISPDGMEKTRDEKGPEAAAARINQFAKALKPFVRRQSDFLGRFEQDKFIILYSGLSRPDMDMLIRRIRETLSKVDWEDAQGDSLSLSLGGVYAMPGNNSVAAQWMLKADDVLRRARFKGPGTVLIEEE